MRVTPSRRYRGLIIAAVVVLVLWAAYEFFWPSYSWEKYIDPHEVRLAAIRLADNTYEVHAAQSPRSLRRLVGAINGGRRRFPQTSLAVLEPIVLHLRGGASVLIRYEQLGERGPVAFRDATHGYYVGRTLYVSRRLRRALRAIRASKKCLVKRPKIPPKSVSRVVLYTGGSHRTLAASHPQARRLVNALGGFLPSVDTSFYAIVDNPTGLSFYRGEVNPDRHLAGTTGALLMLSPPLSMHTNMMLWDPSPAPPAEYQEFKTNMILISDALCIKRSSSRDPRRVVGFSSDAKPNRFYLFDADIPANDEEARQTAEKWNRIIRVIEEAAGSAGDTAR